MPGGRGPYFPVPRWPPTCLAGRARYPPPNRITRQAPIRPHFDTSPSTVTVTSSCVVFSLDRARLAFRSSNSNRVNHLNSAFPILPPTTTMTRPSSRFRDACHGTLAATLLYLRWHLASSPAANTGSSLDVQARQRTLSPVALASWDVLAQTSLLALILFRLSDFLLRSELKETYEVSIKDLERFVSASAAGIWGSTLRRGLPELGW